MRKLLLICTLFIGSLFAQVNFSTATLYKADIDSRTAYEMQQNGAILIDVRTKREFAYSHPKNSINIPIFYEKQGKRALNKEFLEQVAFIVSTNLNKTIILICRSGSRTKFASNVLASQGYTNVYNIKRGFTFDWTKTNLPIEK